MHILFNTLLNEITNGLKRCGKRTCTYLSDQFFFMFKIFRVFIPSNETFELQKVLGNVWLLCTILIVMLYKTICKMQNL